MTTTSITSGTDFIGKTLIIGSTALVDTTNWARIFDFHDGTINTYIFASFRRDTGYLMFGAHPVSDNPGTYDNYIPLIEKYYIYTISFLSLTELKVNVYEYDANTRLVSDKGTTIKTITMPNTILPSITNFWLGKSIFNDDHYNGRYHKVALYNGDLFALSGANILSTLLTLVTSTQTNIINNSTTYTFRALGTNFLGVVVNILDFNTTPGSGSDVDISNIRLKGNGTTSGGYLNIIGSYIEPPHNLNTPNKQWLMYLNTLSSISGDDLTIKPDARRNLLLEVSGNNNIFIKKGDTSYNLTNLITGDASFSNVDISVNLNPLQTNNSRLGLPIKLWGNAYIRDISVTNISISGNMTISGTISNVIEIIPRLANDISSSLGSTTNIWQRAFIRDLSSISTINGTNWPITAGAPGPTGAIGPAGTTTTGSWRDISNLTLTTYHRIYQEISGDISWSAVNGYYGLAKDAYSSLNPLSSGVKAVQTWTQRTIPTEFSAQYIAGVAWSPSLRIFVAVGYGTNNARTMYSYNGINWLLGYASSGMEACRSICWSPERSIFVAVVGESGSYSSNKVMTSNNGINWSEGAVPNLQTANWWADICWSPELGIFVAVADTGTYKIMTSPDGYNWTHSESSYNIARLTSVCWSAQLGIFVTINLFGSEVYTSKNGSSWTKYAFSRQDTYKQCICWSKELGLFVAVGSAGYYRIITSRNGTDWTPVYSLVEDAAGGIFFVDWIPALNLFIALRTSDQQGKSVITSPDGLNWEQRDVEPTASYGAWFKGAWSQELGIFVATAYSGKIMTSSLKGRPPTSYNVFDSSFNRINENGKWDFSNINVTTLTVNNVPVNSDDRLKHNEVVITNGLEIIERLTPKFYQKTQDLLDANYNGDLSGHAWSLEAGLIAQEVLQISDLSFVVGGGDYYEQKYIYKRQTNEVSYNYYEPSGNNYELSNNYYKQRANNYEISYNLVAQAYNLNYNSVFVYGLAAIKELHTKVKAQESTILNQKNIINSLLARVQALEK